MLTCTTCGEEKAESEFHSDKARKTGKAAWCKDCRSESAAKRYYGNRDQILQKMRDEYVSTGPRKRLIGKRSRARYLEKWLSLLPNGGAVSCSVCGYDKCFAAIDFHHIDPNTKEISISAAMQHKPTPEREAVLKKELEKCIILCANCHREHHFGLTEYEDMRG